MRLDKYICKSSEYSLSQACDLIESQRVLVNGELATKASLQVHKTNQVTLDDLVLQPRPFRYYLLNKPAGMICSNVDENYPSVLKLLDVERVDELHIAGRLDADTTGLVLVTDDGHWSFNLTSPKNGCEKTYQVGLSRDLCKNAAKRFQEGLMLQGETKLTLPAKLVVLGPRKVELTLTEGRFHQVKRMFAAIGNRVQTLHRQQIGNLQCDVGERASRSLSSSEVRALANQI
ncbi:pseudouridine synthase [Alginatibacterium sediminis]|uniref:Pseudouridine synthase n=1 Tax=Alginatibacterium sediminis TaxID=2164068 RepID=A0A420EHY3_9ALTE|nr:pseudouridine synthase [Alginatibacterium sediminis]RKF20351.1 pseudouridine synthase [Alginatibacterium sediminis]